MIDAPVLLARLDDGRIFLGVHRDVYKKCCPGIGAIRRLADFNKIADMIDWSVAEAAADRREGLAREISVKGGHR